MPSAGDGKAGSSAAARRPRSTWARTAREPGLGFVLAKVLRAAAWLLLYLAGGGLSLFLLRRVARTMVVQHSVEVSAAAEKVWAAIERPETLGELMRGALGFRVDPRFPPRWREGERLCLRPMLFHVVPLTRADIQVERIDPAERVLVTRERVGPIRRWRHQLTVTPIDSATCRYTERVDTRPGPLAPVVWASLRVLFHSRARRWQRFATTL